MQAAGLCHPYLNLEYDYLSRFKWSIDFRSKKVCLFSVILKCCICELTRVEFFIRIQTSISPLPTPSTSHLKWLRCWWWWGWWYTMVMMMMMISHACFKVIRAFLLNENSCSTEFWFNHIRKNDYCSNGNNSKMCHFII